MDAIHRQYLTTPYGELVLGAYRGQLCLCDWRYRKMRERIDKRLTQGLGTGFIEADDPVLVQTRQQLGDYFAYERKTFDIPLLLVGTDFQRRIWQALIEIQFGHTSSYLALAKRIGNAKAVRAVANANGANAISIIVPCHRIIGSNGELVGYAGGLKAKEALLSLETDLFH